MSGTDKFSNPQNSIGSGGGIGRFSDIPLTEEQRLRMQAQDERNRIAQQIAQQRRGNEIGLMFQQQGRQMGAERYAGAELDALRQSQATQQSPFERARRLLNL